MKRSEVINRVGKVINAATYLEVGVEGGVTFNEVQIARKHGVDPFLKVSESTLNGSFSAQTSDDFFTNELVKGPKFDIIFLDGLHTFEQSLRDLLSSINFVSERGVIILDDVRPSDALSAISDHRRCQVLKEQIGFPDRNWMGDVFKTVAFINDFLIGYSYSTVIESNMLVLWKDKSYQSKKKVFNDVLRTCLMDFSDTIELVDIYNFGALSDVLLKIESRSI